MNLFLQLKKWGTVLTLLLLAIIVIFYQFDGNVWLTYLLKICSGLFSSFALALVLWPDEPYLKKIEKYLRRIPVLRDFLPKIDRAGSDETNRLDSKYDAFGNITSYSQILMDGIEGGNEGNIFSWRLKPQVTFSAGTEFNNRNNSWVDRLDTRQFQVILGPSGVGKTYELIRRFEQFAVGLAQDMTAKEILKGRKVPVFIVLKGLSGPPDDETIFQYLSKDSSSFGIMAPRRLRDLIDTRQFDYFFDGLDEVPMGNRHAFLHRITEIAKETSVIFTCRHDVYTELLVHVPRQFKSIEEINPAAYIIAPLSGQQLQFEITQTDTLSESYKAELIEFIQGDEKLETQLGSPLILNLFIKVFAELSEAEKARLKSLDRSKIVDWLWGKYEDYIALRKLEFVTEKEFVKLRTYSVWLAHIMDTRLFNIEDLQPDWLRKVDDQGQIVPAKRLEQLFILSSRLLICLLIGIAVGCIIASPFALLGTSVVGSFITSALARHFKENYEHEDTPEAGRIRRRYIIFLSCSLVFGCGLYQGLAIPRADKDMSTIYFSVPECVTGILLGMVLSVFYGYRVIMEASQGKYIVPVEQYSFDWKRARKEASGWGILIGATIGGFAILARHLGSSVIAEWIDPAIQKLSVRYIKVPIAAAYKDIALFVYGFGITFTVAFLIIIILAGRHNESRLPGNKKHRLNYGMKSSLLIALYQGLGTAFVVSVLFSPVVIFVGMESLWHGYLITVGIAVLSFLWIGGMEVINHALLRLNLYWRGIAPLNYDTWFEKTHAMGLIREVDAGLTFYHETLASYFRQYNRSRSALNIRNDVRLDRWLYSIAIVACIYLAALPFYHRYFSKSYYWKHASEFKTEMPPNGFKRLSDTTFFAERAGNLSISASGSVNVGTIVGKVHAFGTSVGFFGLPIGTLYNAPEGSGYRHAAFLYQVCTFLSGRLAFRYVNDTTKKRPAIEINKGDTIRLLVNDKEWKNNTGHFLLTIGIIPLKDNK